MAVERRVHRPAAMRLYSCSPSRMKRTTARKHYRRKWKPVEPYMPGLAFFGVVWLMALVAALSCIDGC